ncbi:hypothetical protein FACS1894122_08970 [Alphaproteobacteria bacterium]|nr:hypothetical protein FACS1894122_08970 [Alphaproteobacteria bacterium]
MRKITEDELKFYAAFDSRKENITKKERRDIRDELHSRCKIINANDEIFYQLRTLIGPTIYEVLGIPMDEIVVDEIVMDGVSLDEVELISLDVVQNSHIKSGQLTRIISMLNDICNFIYRPYKHQIETLRERILEKRNKTKLKTEKRSRRKRAARNKQKVAEQ